jgi:hypothetical protein
LLEDDISLNGTENTITSISNQVLANNSENSNSSFILEEGFTTKNKTNITSTFAPKKMSMMTRFSIYAMSLTEWEEQF